MLFQPFQQYHRHSFNSSRRNMIGTTWTIFRHPLDNLDTTLGHPWDINFETALGLVLKSFETISGQRWDSIEIACGQLWDNLDTTLGYLDTTFWQHGNFWPKFETNWEQLWDNFFLDQMQSTFILGSSIALLSLFLSNDSSTHLRNWIYESSVPLLLLCKCLGIGARWKKRLGGKRCNFTQVLNFKNIAKGTTDSKVEFISQDHSLQFTNLEHITISESRLSINFKISTKHQHLD